MDKVTDLQAAVEATSAREREKHGLEEPQPLLSWPNVSVGRLLENAPSPVSWLFTDLIVVGIVGAIIAAGGVGKSFLLLQIAFALATGRNFGPFKPSKAYRVLYLGGEDPENELHRRVWIIAQKAELSRLSGLPETLGICSTVGKIGPLIALDESRNPALTDAYRWLDESLRAMPGVEVLFIDPMSRYYGLPENDNSCMTAWIQALEKLSLRHNLTILFAHHEPKNANKAEDLRESSGRGGSALKDGCRWTAALRHMREQEGELFGIDHRDYVEFDVSKSNYAPMLSRPAYFRRCPGGVLEPVNLRHAKLSEMAERLCVLLRESGKDLTRLDLTKESAGKEIARALKESFEGFKRGKDMPALIDYSLSEGLLKPVVIPSGPTKQPKEILRVRAW